MAASMCMLLVAIPLLPLAAAIIIHVDDSTKSLPPPPNILVFTAPWCTPCKSLIAHLLAAAPEVPIPVLLVDGPESPHLIDIYKITSYPTVIANPNPTKDWYDATPVTLRTAPGITQLLKDIYSPTTNHCQTWSDAMAFLEKADGTRGYIFKGERGGERYELFEDAANSHRHSPVTFLTVADESTVPFTFRDGVTTVPDAHHPTPPRDVVGSNPPPIAATDNLTHTIHRNTYPNYVAYASLSAMGTVNAFVFPARDTSPERGLWGSMVADSRTADVKLTIVLVAPSIDNAVPRTYFGVDDATDTIVIVDELGRRFYCRGCEDFGEFADKFVRGDAVRTVKSSNNAAVLSPRVSYTNSNAIMTSVAEGEMVIFMMAECGGCVRVKKKLLELPDEGVHVYIINVETDEVEDVEVGMVPVMFERGSGGLLQVGGVEAIVDWCKAEGSKPGVSDNKGEL